MSDKENIEYNFDDKYEEIIAAAHDAGTKWVVVEQDTASDGMNSLECAEKSFEHISSLNK